MKSLVTVTGDGSAPAAVDTGVLNPPRSSTTMPASTRSHPPAPARRASPSSSSSRPPRPARSRRCSGEVSSSSRRSATSATCRDGPTRSPPPTRARGGPAWASTWTTGSSRCTWSRPRRSRSSPASSHCWPGRARSTSPPTRTARASRSRGISPRCSRRGCRSNGWSSTRSPRPRSSAPWRSGATSTAAS